MKDIVTTLLLSLLLCCTAAPVVADCPPGSNWTSTWTDPYGQTTYTLEGPCKAYIGIPFDIVATVTDGSWPDSDVAYSWALRDNGAILLGGGFNWLTLSSGSWQRTYTQTYTGSPIDHTLLFTFSDMGEGAGAHNYRGQTIGALTVDPWLIDAGADRILPASAQNMTVLTGTAPIISDPSLSYRWLEGTTELQATQPVDAAGEVPFDLGALAPLALGPHLFTLEVSDGVATATDTVQITFQTDEMFPVCGNITSFSVPATSSNGSIRLVWSQSATTGVDYVLTENGVEIYRGPNLNFTVSNRDNGSYSYTVRAVKTGYLDSRVSGPYTSTVTLACGNISSFFPAATNTTGSYRLAWSNSSTAGVDYVLTENGVEIYRGPNLEHTVSGHGNGSYLYTLKAVKDGYLDSIVKGGKTVVTLTCGNISSFFPPKTSGTGSYRLAWSKSGTSGVDYVLTENGTEIYRGPSLYFYISGRTAGSYVYTLKAVKAGYLDSIVKGGTTVVGP